MRAPIRGAVKGQAYTVRWRVVSADGHVGTGVFTFGVGVTPPPPTEAVGASGVTWRDDVARWALFASLALMIGVVGIRLLVLPRVVDPRVERRVYLLGTLGALLALNTGIAGFVIRSANALQVSGVDLLYADLSPFAESTRFGNAFLVTTLRVRDLPHDPRARVGARRAAPALAGVPARARARLGLPALGTPGHGAELDGAHRDRGLGAPRDGDALGRRRPDPRGRRLAARAGSPPRGVSPLLAHRGRS